LSYLTSLMHITSAHEFLDLDLRITQAFKRLSVDSKSCAMGSISAILLMLKFDWFGTDR